ncbi:MAG: hypothetical protein V4503_01600 [Gemmatimonadota bacterium]
MVILLAPLLSDPVQAQAVRVSGLPPEVARDSVLVERLLSATFARLGDYLAFAALDTVPRPIEIVLPDTVSAQWKGVLRQMESALRARAPMASDQVILTVGLGSVRIVGDTAFATIVTSVRWRCKNDWRSGGRLTYIAGVRRENSWEYPFRITGGGAGDSLPCSFPN